ncbi:hypothetical protein CNEO_50060 [Clostridium neonatale]|uniref:Uncharacterized protein n=1 Tax=Clostridium neonatale TaxID=137838 RepID=A0AA86K0N3_9CLOT|nr:hypothetical protein CNEO_50060 [Clostridium neonatale]
MRGRTLRVPTIHEGYGARLRAKNGKECDRIEINRYNKYK